MKDFSLLTSRMSARLVIQWLLNQKNNKKKGYCWYFRCSICQHKQSSKDKLRETADEETAAEGTSLASLFENASLIRRRGILSFLCLVICSFVCFENRATLLRSVEMIIFRVWSLRMSIKKKKNSTIDLHFSHIFGWVSESKQTIIMSSANFALSLLSISFFV